MWANNETGVVNPVAEVCELCRQRRTFFHCDAVQAAGKLPIAFGELAIDYLTISGHKIFGPKGAGALVVANGAPFTAMLYGGHQENDRRGGTENVPVIVGFGKAAELAVAERIPRTTYVQKLRDELESRILAEIQGACLNGSNALRIPNTTNIGVCRTRLRNIGQALGPGRSLCIVWFGMSFRFDDALPRDSSHDRLVRKSQ